MLGEFVGRAASLKIIIDNDSDVKASNKTNSLVCFSRKNTFLLKNTLTYCNADVVVAKS
jgi:hypothetical protein